MHRKQMLRKQIPPMLELDTGRTSAVTKRVTRRLDLDLVSSFCLLHLVPPPAPSQASSPSPGAVVRRPVPRRPLLDHQRHSLKARQEEQQRHHDASSYIGPNLEQHSHLRAR